MLFVTFWRLNARTLPHGFLEKRRISVEEARSLVEGAKQANGLVCISEVDLAAPYRKNERRRHAELCMTLKELSIPLSIEDFFSETCCNVPELAKVGKSGDLLFVDCGYSIMEASHDDRKSIDGEDLRQGLQGWSSLFSLDPASIAFDLYSLMNADGVR